MIRDTSLNPELDIAGSTTKDSTKNLTDEANSLGDLIQSGSSATISSVSGSNITITGLASLTSLSQGRYLRFTNAANSQNNGEFLISSVLSASSCIVINPNVVLPEANSGSLQWEERDSYTLTDDINFIRTDRANIKGTSYDSAVPNYQRPDATSTNVPTNLSNIAGKTTDAKVLTYFKSLYKTVSISDTFITLTSSGQFPHASVLDTTGIPVYDVADSLDSSLVNILDGYSNQQLTVQSGIHAGEIIIAFTRAGSSTSPNSVEIEFRSLVPGNPLSSSVSYTWESSQSTYINVFYSYRERLDLLDENAFKNIVASRLSSSSGLSSSSHQTLRQLVHLAEEGGPYHGFASGLYQEILPIASPFPTQMIWWESSAKVKKIVEEIIVYNSNKTIASDTWRVYDTDGITVLATSVDTFTYSGVFLLSSLRTLS